MKGFIRFRNVAEGHFLALVAPRYDVLPLVRRHFEDRFSDQQWIIYDTRRNYGLAYDKHTTRAMQLDPSQLEHVAHNVKEDKQNHEALWRRYYRAINIDVRNNPKQHLQQLPRRFWRHLPEMQ